MSSEKVKISFGGATKYYPCVTSQPYRPGLTMNIHTEIVDRSGATASATWAAGPNDVSLHLKDDTPAKFDPSRETFIAIFLGPD